MFPTQDGIVCESILLKAHVVPSIHFKLQPVEKRQLGSDEDWSTVHGMKLHVTVFLDHFCLNSHSRKVILTTFSALLKSVKHFLTHFRLFFYCYYTHWFLHVLHYERYLLVCSCTSHLNMTTHQNRLFVLFLVSTLDF